MPSQSRGLSRAAVAEPESGATAACVPCAACPGTSRLTSSRDADRARARAEVGAHWAGEEEGKSPAAAAMVAREQAPRREPQGKELPPRTQRDPAGAGVADLGPPLRFSWPWRDPLPPELPAAPVAPVDQDPEWKKGGGGSRM
ncbi:hypothetical protein mRhiFer1_010088 [Rhinolophus ferrumequinum]|uniref:Uncharacterized protein n=1 Tax=Rhinolophus ferrumequinum TaxID=59479 RepID=A0A7J7XPD0_RHIFE|nr:hypothetical protein mRhiFer1_010088 [Rhinolophus ferrumequinum]